MIYLGSEDQTIKLWSVTGGSEIRQLKGHNKVIRSIAFSPSGEFLASGEGHSFIDGNETFIQGILYL